MLDVKLSKFGGNSFMKTEHKEAAVSVQMKHQFRKYYLFNNY